MLWSSVWACGHFGHSGGVVCEIREMLTENLDLIAIVFDRRGGFGAWTIPGKTPWHDFFIFSFDFDLCVLYNCTMIIRLVTRRRRSAHGMHLFKTWQLKSEKKSKQSSKMIASRHFSIVRQRDQYSDPRPMMRRRIRNACVLERKSKNGVKKGGFPESGDTATDRALN